MPVARTLRGKFRESAFVPPPSECPPGSISISPGGLTQTALNLAGAGAIFCLADGVYRQATTLVPLANQRFVAVHSRQAIISGATLYTAGDFTLSGGLWFIGGQTQQGTRYTVAQGIGNELGYPEQVFYDDLPLLQVANKTDLSSGEFWFDYANDEIWVFDNPAGHKIEIGNGVSAPLDTAAGGVRLEGLVIEKCNNYAEGTALPLENGARASDCEIRWNYGTGTKSGPNSILEFSEVHDNRGAGLWFDIDNVDTLVDGGTYEDNGRTDVMYGVAGYATSGYGIVAEIGYDILIQNATAQNNNGPGIISSNNRGMEVTGCTARGNGATVGSGPGEIYGLSSSRGNSGATSGGTPAQQVIAARYGNNPPRVVRDFYAHDNTIGLSEPTTLNVAGIESISGDPNDPALFEATFNNRWEANHYEFADTLARYEWQDVSRTGIQWRSGSFTWQAMDATGTWA